MNRFLAAEAVLVAAALLWPGASAAQPGEASFKGLQRDALVLTQGHGNGGFINIKLARDVQKALTRIRAAFPVVAGIHARGYDLRSLLIVLTQKAQARLPRKLKKKTGVLRLDRLNARFRVASVQLVSGPSLLRLRFSQPMDVVHVAKQYGRLPELRSVSPNTFVGDGHDIALEMDARQWRFKFKKGSGDCPSGCIKNEYFYISYAPATGAVKRHIKK